MACEQIIQVIQPTVQPTLVQVIQQVQVIQPPSLPESVDLLINGLTGHYVLWNGWGVAAVFFGMAFVGFIAGIFFGLMAAN